MDRLNKKEVALINASAKAQLTDADANAVPDVLEISKIGNEYTKMNKEHELKMAELQNKAAERSDKLKIEREKLQVQKENMKNDKEIALINARNRNTKKPKK